MRGIVAGVMTATVLASLAGLTGPAAARAAARAGGLAPGALPVTRITVNGSGGGRVYDGVGAILGGGGNARYLMDYPARQRGQILDYLFRPGYGASLQILKLEIGGDADSSDGSEPSVEHTLGRVSCRAGYEFSIARAAVRRNPRIRLYGLQWAAPRLVRQGGQAHFTGRDISYLLSWLGCARQRGLTISYLGGWNETDDGTGAAWFRRLREALNAHGFARTQIIAADSSRRAGWHYAGDPAVAILGTHDVCGFPTGVAGPATQCVSPWSTGHPASQPMWASELGGMDAGAAGGCLEPCAPAMDRAVIRGYVDARLTGFLEWPALDAMPPGLPFENRGLVTADQPWAGSYRVNAMTWAIAQVTQFAQPPAGRVRWRYLDGGSGYLQGDRADGSYVSLVRDTGGRGTAWSTIIEATTATAPQMATFRVTGGRGLAGQAVHVWASDFTGSGDPARWFARQPGIRPSVSGTFTLMIRPGWVYSLTTTSGQGKGTARGRAPAPLRLPFTESLASSGAAGPADDEPPYLAAQDGAFGLARCTVPDRGRRTCTEQQAVPVPVLWHGKHADRGSRYPYAVIGDAGWASYRVSVDVLLPGRGASAGVIGRFSCRRGTPDIGQFDGYLLDVSGTGRWQLIRNANGSPDASAGCRAGPGGRRALASGRLPRPWRPGTWHQVSLTMSGATITAAADGRVLALVTDSSWTSGLAGLEASAFTRTWPRIQYSHLTVTRA
jgi:hypothetical protein